MTAVARIDRRAYLRQFERELGPRAELVRGRIGPQVTGGTRDHRELAPRATQPLLAQLDEASWTTLYDRGVETTETIRCPDGVVEPAMSPPKAERRRGPLSSSRSCRRRQRRLAST